MTNNRDKFASTKHFRNIEHESVSVRKSYSVYFLLNTPVAVNAIIEAFNAAGVENEDIVFIQTRLFLINVGCCFSYGCS